MLLTSSLEITRNGAYLAIRFFELTLEVRTKSLDDAENNQSDQTDKDDVFHQALTFARCFRRVSDNLHNSYEGLRLFLEGSKLFVDDLPLFCFVFHGCINVNGISDGKDQQANQRQACGIIFS